MAGVRLLGALEAVATATAILLLFFHALGRVLDSADREDGVVHAEFENLRGVAHLDNELGVLLHQILDDSLHRLFVS